jgi:hypothetical protein
MQHPALIRSTKASLFAVCVFLVASCSSTESELSVEIVDTVRPDQSGATFTASGEAVEEGVVCAAGESLWLGNLAVDGEPLSDEAMNELYTSGDAYSIVVQHEYVCDDGSGSFMLDATPVIDPSLEETQDAPVASSSWVITGGTGPYESLTGSGDVTQESLSDRMTTAMVGTVSEG